MTKWAVRHGRPFAAVRAAFGRRIAALPNQPRVATAQWQTIYGTEERTSVAVLDVCTAFGIFDARR